MIKNHLTRNTLSLLTTLCVMLLTSSLVHANNWSLGSIGGTFSVQPGTNYLKVESVEGSGPGGVAGLQAGDYIYKASGSAFSELSTNRANGYKGSVQDLAIAIELAEAGNGALNLTVLRPGAGDVNLDISLPATGAFGPAYPLGSSKFDAMYQWGCAEIHSQVTASADGGFGYDTGFYGLILLSHPNWNDTTGAKPYGLSVVKLKDWCVNYLQGRITSPVEPFNLDGTPNDGSSDDSNPVDQSFVNPGLENWSVASASMFLAEYRIKTGDTSLNGDCQNAADMLANRIHTEADSEGLVYGRMGHGGLSGHYGNKALNIINAHTMPALAMLKRAGATINDTKFQASWSLVSGSTNSNSNSEDGAVGYRTLPGGDSDSTGRTAGVAFGMENYYDGVSMSLADQAIVDTQKDYVWRQWERMQHAHAYTVGGVVFTQFLLPYLEDRQQRYLMENQKLFYHFSRNTAGTLSYFGGRYNNGGDDYLNFGRVAIINTCMAQAIASGNLPSFPSVNTDRLHADFISPALTWPSIDARYMKTSSGSVDFSNVNITDYLGSVLNTGDYTVTWSHVSGPATATFSSTNTISPTVTLPTEGRYRIQLEVTKDGYTLTEPIDIDYAAGGTPDGYAVGSIVEDIYTSINGVDVTDLTSATAYPNSPNIKKTSSSIEGTHNADNYGSRLRGYIIPPVTGDYTFYIAADGNADFYLSSDTTAANKAKISYTTTATDPYEWNQDPEQSSNVQSLTAGQPYYFEVLHKAGSGADHVAVAWTYPGISTPEVISSQYIAGTAIIIAQPQSATVAAGSNVTLNLSVQGSGPFLYQWRRNGVAHGFASTSADLVLTNVGAGAAGNYDCVITTPAGTLTSDPATVTVTGVGVLTQGGLWRDVFSGIAGAEVSDVTSLTNYPNFPDSGGVITSAESPQNEAENYGSRWTGWLKPDTTGAHTFYLTGDNTAELWISTDDQPGNIVKVAALTTHTSYRDWDGGAISNTVNLVSGTRYYIEVLHKESKGGDHCSVTWRRPGDAVPTDGSAPIASQYLEYLTGGVYYTYEAVTLTRVSPALDSVKIRPSVGLELECSVDLSSLNATTTWTKQSGPGTVTFTDAASLATRATFSVEGDYVLRCTYDNGNLPATYDISVNVTNAATTSWNSASIAEPTVGNGVLNPNGSITVNGSGSDIYGASDQCHLFYQNLTGDFDVRSRVVSKTITSGSGTHAQLQARESVAANARNAAISHEISDRIAYQYREDTGGATSFSVITQLNLPLWIRLVRSGGDPTTGAAGQTFTGYYSTNGGATWIERSTNTYTTAMPETLLVGFAVSSGRGNGLNEVVYDNVSGFAVSGGIAAVPNAGSDFSTASNTGVALSGSSTDDGLPLIPGVVTNAWSQASGPGSATFADATALSTTVDFSAPGVYVLRLTSDDGSAKTYDEVTVSVAAGANAPVASDATFTVAESIPAGTIVGTVAVTDLDAGDAHTFAITAGNTGNAFAISSLGVITTTADLDFETLNSYSLTAEVSDLASLSDTATITVNVTNVVAGDDSDGDGVNDDWEAANYGSSTAVTSSDDTDSDGFTTFEEMVFGTDPTVGNAQTDVVKDSVIDDAGTDKLELSFRRPLNYATLGVTYSLQSTTTLSGWAADSTVPTSITADADGVTEWVKYRFTLGSKTRDFVRMKVTPNP